MADYEEHTDGGSALFKPVKVGVIGIGNMGQHHARVLSRLKDVS
ncbi:MAG: gfo/Idh/MocA family oxidoreductase, partial [Cyanobacteria bacterium P01_H01_bin.119]